MTRYTQSRQQSAELLRLAAVAGARVEEASGRVRIPAPLLRQLLAQAPAQYEIAGAGSRRYQVGGSGQLSNPASCAAFLLWYTGFSSVTARAKRLTEPRSRWILPAPEGLPI